MNNLLLTIYYNTRQLRGKVKKHITGQGEAAGSGDSSSIRSLAAKDGIPRAPVIVNTSLNGMDTSKMSDVRSKSDGHERPNRPV